MEQFGLKEVLIGLVLLLQGVGVKALFRGADALNAIRTHLATLNGRMLTCEELRQVHDRNDKEKHDDCAIRLHEVERAVLARRRSDKGEL